MTSAVQRPFAPRRQDSDVDQIAINQDRTMFLASAMANSSRSFRSASARQPESHAPTTARRISEALALIHGVLAPQRQVVHEGDFICQAGERFDSLYVLNSGCAKIVTLTGDGREQVV